MKVKTNWGKPSTCSVIAAVITGLLLLLLPLISRTVYAAPSTNLNFQARLASSTGSVVPDGNYHVEFRLYNLSSGGSALWTETRTTGNLVRIVNGYLTVNLGLVNAFPTSINWNEEHWLTMNIGGTGGAASWDGEMNPRLKLTAVPYAFQAGSLAKTDGANRGTLAFNTVANNPNITLPDATGTVCLQTSVDCGFASSSGSGNYIQNSTALQANANLAIQSVGDANVAALIRARSSQTADLLQFQNSAGTNPLSGINSAGNLYYRDGASGFVATLGLAGLSSDRSILLPNAGGTICTTAGNCIGNGGAGDIFNGGQAGPITIGTNDNTTFTLETNNTPAITILGNGNVGIGTATTPAATLEVKKTIADASGDVALISPTFAINSAGSYSYNGLKVLGSVVADDTYTGITNGTYTQLTASDTGGNFWGTARGQYVAVLGHSALAVDDSAQLQGQYILAQNQNPGSDPTITGSYINVEGRSTTSYGLRINVGTYSVLGNAADAYALYIDDVEVQSLGDQYAIYQAGSDDINYFAGNVGIGITNPSATLEVVSSATTTNVQTITANSLTSGNGLSLTSNASAFTGILLDVSITGNNSANTGTVGKFSVTGASSAAIPLTVSNNGTNNSFLVLDDGDSDLTPFKVDSQGHVGIGQSGGLGARLSVVGNGGVPLLLLTNGSSTTDVFKVTDDGQTRVRAATDDVNLFFVQDSSQSNIFNINSVTKSLQLTSFGAKTAAFSGTSITNIATSSTASINKYGLEIQSTGTWNGASSNNVGLYISSVTGGTNNYDAIFNGGGNVGIGTTAPSALLSVGGTTGNLTVDTLGNLITDGTLTVNGTNFTNAGSTLYSGMALGNFATGGSIGTAAATVDIKTSFTIAQTTANQTITVPSPTDTAAGRIIYISNVGTTSFTLLGVTVNNSSTATLVWNGTAWTFAGADGSSILNQRNIDQNAHFRISGTGQANTAFISPVYKSSDSQGSSNSANVTLQSGDANTGNNNGSGTVTIKSGDSTNGNNGSSGGIVIDAGAKSGAGTAGSISLGATNASAILLGRSGITTTINGSLTVATGSTFTNSSSTLFTAIAITNKATGGNIGTAATTVDVATTFDVSQTTAGQTLTLPSPTVTTAGRIAFVSNVGTVSFTMYGVIISPSTTSIYFWNGTLWTPAGVDGSGANYIQNQNSADQTANFRISGSGQAGGGFTGPSLDVAAAGTLSVGTGANNNAITLGRAGVTTTNAGALTVTELTTLNGNLTIETGDTFTFNGDAFTDLTGTGLTVSGGSLQTTLGTSVDLASAEVTGILGVTNGGTGTNTQFTQGSIVFAGASGVYTQDNSNFYFDDTNNTIGIGTTRSGAIDGTGNSRVVIQGSGSTSSTSALNIRNSSGSGSIFLVRDDGNVGIGTTAPGKTLDVAGSTRILATSGTNGNGSFIWDGTTNLLNYQGADVASTTYAFFGTNRTYTGSAWTSTGFYGARAGATLQVENDALAFYQFAASSNTPVQAFRIATGGNVGIGTSTFGTSAAGVLALGQATAPSTSPADNVQLYVTDAGAGDSRLRVRMEGGGVVTFPNETGTICTTGSVCAGYAAAATNGYVQFAPTTVQADTTTNSSIFINKTGASGNILQLQKSGVDQLVVTNGGSVGIGTATPTAKLQVVGSSNFSGDIGSSGLSGLQSQANNFNLLPNSSFEVKTTTSGVYPDGWTGGDSAGNGSASTTLAFDSQSDGRYAVKSVTTGTTSFSYFQIVSPMPIKASTPYISAIDARHDTTANNCSVGFISRIHWYTSSFAAASTPYTDVYSYGPTTTSWATYSGTATSPADATFAQVFYYNFANTGSCTRWYDNAVFRQVGFNGTVAFGLNGGNVGIGTAIPNAKLEVVVQDGGNVQGMVIAQNDLTNNPRALSILNAGTANSLFIQPSGNTSASTSAGGAILLDNTNNTGAGMVIYSNQSAPTGHLLSVRADHTSFNQSGIYVSYAGTANALNIVNNSTSSTGGSLNVTSSNPNESTLKLTGQETGKGTIKITHTGTGTDANASAISISLAGTGTASQGIFLDAPDGGTTGKLLNLRNNGSEVLTLDSANLLKISKSVTGVQNFINLQGMGAFSGSEPALVFSNSAGNVETARISSKPGTSYTNSLFTISTADASKVLQPRLSIDVNGNVGIGTTIPTANLSFGGEVSRTIRMEARTGNTAGNNLTIAAGGGGAGASAVAGGQLILQGGAAAGSGAAANGGVVTISGGAGIGTGTQGLVNLSTTAFTSASVQTFAASGSITAGNIDLYSTLPITASSTSVVVTVPDPAQNVIGRLVYIAARSGSNDFTLRFNSARIPIDIAMKANSTATLIWNGTDWTAAGASSSTDLQSAYNNTLTSAGGAELVLNASGGAADGLTIRNNATTPISGGILEVQSSIGTNLFSVNNFGTELAANGGSETSSTFATNWTAAPAGGTVTRTTTAGQFVTGLAGAQVVTTTTANTGIRNNLSGNPVNTIGAVYQVSFTAKSSLNGTAIDVQYSRNGGTNMTACTNYGAAGAQTLSNTVWTKITCTITIDSATAATDPDLYIRKTDAATAPTIYIDNLSFIRNDTTTQPSNVQVGGGINGGPVTLFTLDRSSAPPVANGNTTYYGSMYYDTTTGRIQCYESDGWGACGSAPDNIITLTPEYTGAVLNGTGIGVMTADFCGNGGGLAVNTSFCASGEARNYYRWTSPQATDQTYSIYVNYKLPSTFKEFIDDNTIKLTAFKDHATNAGATLDVYRKDVNSGTISQCGSSTTITTGTGAWNTTPLGGLGEQSSCGFAAGDYVIFKITVTAKNAANVYIENLDFTYTNK